MQRFRPGWLPAWLLLIAPLIGCGQKGPQPLRLQRLDGQEVHAAIAAPNPPDCGKIDQNRQLVIGNHQPQRKIGVDGQFLLGLDAAAFCREVQQAAFPCVCRRGGK